MVRLFAIFLCCAWSAPLSSAQCISPAKTPTTAPSVSTFVPDKAKLVKSVILDLGKNRKNAVVLAYGWDTVPMIKTGLRLLERRASGWSVTFEESDSVINGAGVADAIDVEKVRSSSGKEAVVVILKNSGAGTTTDWHVLALVNGKIVKLDSGGIRDKVLKRKGYVFLGYNGVTVKGDLVVEDIAGYSPGMARCCPDRPTVAIGTRFTGTSLKFESVQELPTDKR